MPQPFPAYEQLSREIGLGFAQWRVYMHLVHDVLNDHDPADVKVDAVAKVLGMSRRHVRKALDWLIVTGYFREHGRGTHGVRQLTYNWKVTPRSAA
jgi:hypothetical protein